MCVCVCVECPPKTEYSSHTGYCSASIRHYKFIHKEGRDPEHSTEPVYEAFFYVFCFIFVCFAGLAVFVLIITPIPEDPPKRPLDKEPEVGPLMAEGAAAAKIGDNGKHTLFRETEQRIIEGDTGDDEDDDDEE